MGLATTSLKGAVLYLEAIASFDLNESSFCTLAAKGKKKKIDGHSCGLRRIAPSLNWFTIWRGGGGGEVALCVSSECVTLCTIVSSGAVNNPGIDYYVPSSKFLPTYNLAYWSNH